MRALLHALLAFAAVFGLGLSLALPASAGTPSMRAAPVDVQALAEEGLPTLPTDYRIVEGVYARVHHHPEDRSVALLLARHAGRSIPDFADRLNTPVGGPIEIVLAHTQHEFDTLQPGAPPDWADGTAWPYRGLIFLRAPDLRPGTDEPLTTVLDHEIVHILLGRAFGGRPVPRWLQEGVAQVYARQYTAATTDTLASGLLGRDLMSIEDLATGFPADPMRARLAYAQSADLVAWLQNEHGPDAIPTLAREMSRGRGFGAAMREATGSSVDELDAEWRSRLTSSGLWLKPLVSDTTMFTAAAAVLLVGGFGVLRRKKARLDEMEADERAREAVARAMGLSPESLPWDHPVWRHPVAGPDGRDGYWSRPSAEPTVH